MVTCRAVLICIIEILLPAAFQGGLKPLIPYFHEWEPLSLSLSVTPPSCPFFILITEHLPLAGGEQLPPSKGKSMGLYALGCLRSLPGRSVTGSKGVGE